MSYNMTMFDELDDIERELETLDLPDSSLVKQFVTQTISGIRLMASGSKVDFVNTLINISDGFEGPKFGVKMTVDTSETELEK